MYSDLFMILIGIISFLGCLRLLVKKSIEVIKTKPDDPDINAKIINIMPISMDNVRLLLQYDVDGIIKEHVYLSPYPPEEYKIGDDITLTLCRKSGLVYDKKFLKKQLIGLFLLTLIAMLGTLFIVCNFLLKV